MDSRSQKLLIGAAIVLLASTHWVIPRADRQIHNLLYNLDFVPILVSAMLFGWRHAVFATGLTLAAEYPSLRVVWPNDPTYRIDQMGEMVASGIAGVVVGLLADRGRRQRAALAQASEELAKVNQELHDNLDRIARAKRMYAVAQLSSSLAHEIRNPLESISGAAGILRRGHARGQDIEECLEIIQLESQRLNKLLTEFLLFARPRAPRPQATDLAMLIEATLTLARHSGDAGHITFRRILEHPLPEIRCDAEQVKQVLFNVLINAVQATREGAVELRAHVEPPFVIITVKDEGPGIPEGDEEQIFEPFFTTKANGSGLGLPIARTIVEQHGGHISARNAPGRGLMVTLQLPAA